MRQQRHRSGLCNKLIGERKSAQITIGNYGAYLVDNKMKYFLFQWTSMPWKTETRSLDTTGGVARTVDIVRAPLGARAYP